MISRLLIFFSLIFLSFALSGEYLNGIDVFFDSDLKRYKHLRMGVVVNHTSQDSRGNSLVDLAYKNLNLRAIFTPEHGLFGKDEAGKTVSNSEYQGVPVYSLYGKKKMPTSDQLKDLDLIIFDVQDIGSRFYTYISTMTYVMQSIADNEVKMIILDRPNPVGRSVRGPILRNGFQSFVGMHPIPIRHGMTIGELALMIEGMGWISTDRVLDLDIIEVEGWRGEMVDISIPPSPNIPDLETAIIYSGMCILEGTNISEGRGTDLPFKLIGAPWLDAPSVISDVESFGVSGFQLRDTTFIPISIPGKAAYPKYKSELCRGIRVSVLDYTAVHPLKLVVLILKSIYRHHPREFKILESDFLDKLYGSDELKKNIISDQSIDELVLTWKDETGKFIDASRPYIIY